MDDGLTKSLNYAAAISLVLLVCSVLIFFSTGTATVMKNAIVSAQDESGFSTAEDAWQDYQGKVLSGSVVKSVIESYDAFFCIRTKKVPIGFCGFSEIDDRESLYYVNPFSEFIVTKLYGSEGESVGLEFTEKHSKDNYLVDSTIRQSLDSEYHRVQAMYTVVTNNSLYYTLNHGFGVPESGNLDDTTKIKDAEYESLQCQYMQAQVMNLISSQYAREVNP